MDPATSTQIGTSGRTSSTSHLSVYIRVYSKLKVKTYPPPLCKYFIKKTTSDAEAFIEAVCFYKLENFDQSLIFMHDLFI